MAILKVDGLRKCFGPIQAVEDISFAVEPGEVFTIIGPNGAGKTTTLEMIEGLQIPDRGQITVKEMEWKSHAAEIKQIIGVQPQSSALFDLLTVEENLDVFGSFYSKTRPVAEILELINLTDHRTKKVKSLSGGQKQRLAIGLALVNDPDLLFLDEPTTGLDPQARRNIWDIVLKLRALGKTTILTTHYMEEAEKLSDRVCIVDQGKVVALDTAINLIQGLTKEREVRLAFHQGEATAERLRELVVHFPAVGRATVEEERLCFWTVKPEEALYHLFHITSEQGIGVDQITIKEMSLEDVFIAYTGKEWRD